MLIHSTVRAFAVALIMTICAFGQFANTNTFTTSSSFPPVGIASTESVQVTVSNTAAVSSTNTSGLANLPFETVPSCSGSVAFYNATGTIIGAAMPFSVTSGQIYSASLPYASAASTSVRELVRAVVSLTTTFPGAAPCSLSYSLATFDTATGVTHAIITGTGISAIATSLTSRL
jgi:hypothetical protein